MKHLLPFLTSIIFLIQLSAAAQKSESVLWKISGNGISKPSYLFGTVHIAPKKLLYQFPKVMETAIACDYGLFEKGGEEIGDVQYASIHTPPLDSVFTKEEYALVDSFFAASPYGSIKPHNDEADLQAMAQVVVMLKQEKSKNQDSTFDDTINTRLRAMKKQVFQLDETAQMAKTAGRSDYRKIADVIVWLIKNDFRENQTPKNLYDADLYASRLQNDLNLDQDALEFLKLDIVERHTIWLPKIELKMQQGACFIAVGLAHLKYQTGLIQLLRQKGYVLTPVSI